VPAVEVVVLSPRRTTEVRPIYPALAKTAGFQGNVILRVTVHADGSAGSVQVVRSPHRSLNDAAIQAVRKSTFSPASRNGVPEEGTIDVPIRFSLTD
jgi:protein TonB